MLTASGTSLQSPGNSAVCCSTKTPPATGQESTTVVALTDPIARGGNTVPNEKSLMSCLEATPPDAPVKPT